MTFGMNQDTIPLKLFNMQLNQYYGLTVMHGPKEHMNSVNMFHDMKCRTSGKKRDE